MASLNRCDFIGNLGKDPETRYSNAGDAITNISIAVTEKWKKDGQPQERTEWVRVVAYKKLAEIMGQYLKKGSQVYISGRLQTSKWQDQSGQDRYTTEIIANEMQMLGGRGGATDSTSGAGGRQEADGGQPSPQPAPYNDFDDDIPF